MEINKQAYDAYVKEVTPVHNKWLSIVKAFLVGGAICTIGQLVNQVLTNCPRSDHGLCQLSGGACRGIQGGRASYNRDKPITPQFVDVLV